MFGWKRRDKLIARALDEKLYELIAIELRDGVRKDGLWLKAISRSGGSDTHAKSEYIKLRLQSLKDEIEIDAEQSQEQQQLSEEQRMREQQLSEEQRTREQQSSELRIRFPRARR